MASNRNSYPLQRRFPNPFVSGPLGVRRRAGFIIFGILWMVLFHFLLSFNAASSKEMTASTTGTVTASTVSYSSRHHSNKTCTLTTQFTANGKTYNTKSVGVSSSDCKYGVGSQVPIVYNPTNPASYMSTADKSSYAGIAVIDYTIGIASILLGVFAGLWQLAGFRALFANRKPKTLY